MGIDILVNQLVDGKSWRRNCKLLFKAWDIDNAVIFNTYCKSIVAEDMLLKLIKNSQKNGKLQYIINDILFIIDEKSYTDTIIDYCVNDYTNKSFKPTLLCTLAHLKLSNEQLELVNKHTETSEAFFELLIRKLNDKSINAGELELFLQENERFIRDAVNFKEYVTEETEKDKIGVVEAAICKYFDGKIKVN